MLVSFLCSCGATLLISYGVSVLSGGTVFMLFNPVLAGIMAFCPIAMLVFSGTLKDFIFIFLPGKRTGAVSLEKLKNVRAAVELAVFTQLYSGILIAFVALILFLYNYDSRQYAGLNLATVFLSLDYALLFMLALSPVSSALERRMYSVMAEDRDTEAASGSAPAGSRKLQRLGAYIMLILFFIAAFLFVQQTSLKNSKEIPVPLDIPSFLGLILWVLAALLCSGRLHDFGRAIAGAAGLRNISAGDRNRLTGSVNLVMRVLIAAAGSMVITGGVAMLANLRDTSTLVPNAYVALLPAVYALLFCLMLLPVKAAVSRRSPV